jgi:transcriptional adapter 2-alpha
MPLREDFNIEFDNDAELLIADLEFLPDDKPSELELKFQMLDKYNMILEERQRRRQFIIERGMLDLKKLQMNDRKRSQAETEIHQSLKMTVRFASPDEYNELVEKMTNKRLVNQRLQDLQFLKYTFLFQYYFRSKAHEKYMEVDKILENKIKEGGLSCRSFDIELIKSYLQKKDFKAKTQAKKTQKT